MADDLFRIFEEKAVSVLELRIGPEIDALLMDTILEAVTVMLRDGSAWVLDLAQVNYLNSAGLGLLVNIRFRIRKSRGRLALCGLSPALLQLFRSCCLEQLFTIVRSREDALRAVR
ncbi:MAG TPA: STAS domain-containing protein [Tepidisphaeraceae bacterium]|nr:STAS domain-containing protein [Tepidisphaeraceae bacterium]